MTRATTSVRGQIMALAMTLAYLLALDATPARCDDFSFNSTGALGGSVSGSETLGVSGNGLVAVGVSGAPLGSEATSWTKAGGIVGLGDLQTTNYNSSANAASFDGSVIVGSGQNASFSPQAFRWTGGVMTPIPYIGSDASSQANGVSSDGSVVVGSETSNITGNTAAWQWTQATGAVSLGVIAGNGDTNSVATAISADGTTIVGSSSGDFGTAMRWTSATGMVGLPQLPGVTDSFANGVSANGSLVVGSGYTSPTNIVAFRWDASTNQTSALGDLPGGITHSEAFGVSGVNNIAVGFGTSATGTEAVKWDKTGNIQSISSILTQIGLGPQIANWQLNQATGISQDGRTIVGTGTDPNGNPSGWVAHDLQADVNGDWRIDIQDLTQVANNWLTSNPAGDATGDGRVDINDLTAIANHWLQGAGGSGGNVGTVQTTPVPEPATIWMALTAALAGGYLLRGRRRV